MQISTTKPEAVDPKSVRIVFRPGSDHPKRSRVASLTVYGTDPDAARDLVRDLLTAHERKTRK